MSETPEGWLDVIHAAAAAARLLLRSTVSSAGTARVGTKGSKHTVAVAEASTGGLIGAGTCVAPVLSLRSHLVATSSLLP